MISAHTCPLARLGSRETGGMNVYVRELSRHLGQRGVAVDVFTRLQADDVPEIVEFGPNARVIHVKGGPVRSMDKYQVLDHLSEFLENVRTFKDREQIEYDIVHSHYWLSWPVAFDLSREWSVPLVSMSHTLGKAKNHVSTNGYEYEDDVRIGIEQEAVDVSDRLVAASPTDMQQIMGYYKAKPRKIWMIPEGVDTTMFRPLDQLYARTSLGMGEGLQVLFVGRIQRLKGIDLLLRAFAIVARDWRGTDPLPQLTVVGGRKGGSGPEAEELARLELLTASLGLQDRVTFRNAVPHIELPALYSAADLVVMPSTYESFGLVALEAMACGTPVIASKVGGLQWTVRDGETGILVDERTPEAFAQAMGKVLLDAALRGRMSRSAVEVARTYSWDGVADKILEMYGELLPCKRGDLVSSTG